MKKILLIILFINLIQPIFSQEENYLDSVSLPMVTIAVKKFENLKNTVPNQIEILNKENIQFLNTPTTAELLTNINGVTVQKSQQGGGSPILRGFEANKILLVLDDVRMNNAIYRGGHLQNALRVDNSMLERAEVVFGPGSVIYGSDALGGVVHFRTISPKLIASEKSKFSCEAFMRYATANNEKTIGANLNIANSRWASLTAFSFSDYDDLRQGKSKNPFNKNYSNLFFRNDYIEVVDKQDFIRINSDNAVQKYSGYFQYSIMEKVKFQQNNNVSHQLNLYYTNTSDIPRYDRLTDRRNGELRSAEWLYGPENWLMGSYQLKVSGLSFVDNFLVTINGQNAKESRITRAYQSVNRKQQHEKVSIFGLNIDALKRFNHHELQYGIETAYNNVTSTASLTDILTNLSTNADTRYPDGGANTSNYSAYITDTYNGWKKLNLQGGLRYQYYNLKATFVDKTFFPLPYNSIQQNSSAVVGNFGMVYQPNLTWKIGVLGSSGFRAPNVDDAAKVFESVAGTLIIPNTNLKPEYSYNTEINIEKIYKNVLRIELNGYYTILTNLLTLDHTTLNGEDSITYDNSTSAIYTTVNKDKGYITGAFINLESTFSKNITIKANINYTYGRIIQNEKTSPLDHIQPINGKVNITYSKNKFQGSFYVPFNGWKRIKDYRLNAEDNERYATPEGMPAWFTLNLKLSYQLFKKFQVQAGVENILDSNYRTFASGISAPGRNYIIAARVNW
ncbi:MAG: TonB-dependent receptor [Saprospiraceae bacterium]|nr:TonB-dependent receptor [Saprospiraceae bacterium]